MVPFFWYPPPKNRILYQNVTIICSIFLTKNEPKKRYNNSNSRLQKTIKTVRKFEQNNGTKIYFKSDFLSVKVFFIMHGTG